MIKHKSTSMRGVLLAGVMLMCSTGISLAQSAEPQATAIPLDDLSAFQNPGKSWQIAGGVTAELDDENELETVDGKGVLVNEPSRRNKGKDLVTNAEYGDMDLELDYMMAKGSNSGVYLQGRYEVQLEDSWGVKTPTSANNGAIYERWDESKPNGQKGYQGYAPRQNVSRAPGLWQNLKISFQAPRFDASGKKIENAKILRATLNGVVIHENVELFGPTRGAMGNNEVPSGPLRLQGDSPQELRAPIVRSSRTVHQSVGGFRRLVQGHGDFSPLSFHARIVGLGSDIDRLAHNHCAAPERQADGRLVPGLLQHLATAGGDGRGDDGAAGQSCERDNAHAGLTRRAMWNIRNHGDVLSRIKRLLQGNQRPCAAFVQFTGIRTTARSAHRLEAELFHHQRVEFGIGASRDHREQPAALRIEAGRQEMLAVPQRHDSGAELRTRAFEIG